MPVLRVTTERWPIAGAFTISRGSKTEAHVVVAQLRDGDAVGRGECVPYPRYGETVEGVAATIETFAAACASGLSRAELAVALPAGAARNALDCALWDFEAKTSGRPIYDLLSAPPPRPLVTAYTISLGEPGAMAAAARAVSHRPLLKIKLGAAGDAERIAAVRNAVPDTELIVDANEGWSAETLEENFAACAAAGVTLIEQPLPAQDDDALGRIARPVPVCADESGHDRASLRGLVGKYDAVNVKLDKTGGLTEALAMAAEAHAMNLAVMVGCMICTSLSIAPALMVAQHARFVDLDGPLLLAHDRSGGLRYEGSTVMPPAPSLWG